MRHVFLGNGQLYRRDVVQTWATYIFTFFSHVVLPIFIPFAILLVATKTFVSVWCFFAAVLSLLVLVHFSGPMQACRPALGNSCDPVPTR